MRVAALRARTSDRTDGPREGALALARALADEPILLGTPAPSGPRDWATDLGECREALLDLPTDVDVLAASQCTVALSTLPRRPADERILWLDAHGDFNTPRTSPSGYLGGMPLAGAVGAWDAGLGLDPVDPARVVLVGARDLDPGERALLDRFGIERLASAEAARELAGAPVFVHFDADVLGPEHVDGFDFPVAGGLAPDAVRDLLARLDVRALEVCALPLAGVELVADLLTTALASDRTP